jgi:hypothetical protein
VQTVDQGRIELREIDLFRRTRRRQAITHRRTTKERDRRMEPATWVKFGACIASPSSASRCSLSRSRLLAGVAAQVRRPALPVRPRPRPPLRPRHHQQPRRRHRRRPPQACRRAS